MFTRGRLSEDGTIVIGGDIIRALAWREQEALRFMVGAGALLVASRDFHEPWVCPYCGQQNRDLLLRVNFGRICIHCAAFARESARRRGWTL